MTKQKEKKKASIVKKMMIAVVAGFVVGFICLLIKSAVMGTDGEGAWKVVEAILFQDITATKDIEGLGLFYIVGQLFMKGLQMMIVPLVLCSLTLALCSLANPKKLGRIWVTPLLRNCRINCLKEYLHILSSYLIGVSLM